MYTKIVNPKTGRRVNINSNIGRRILRHYLSILSGGAFNSQSTDGDGNKIIHPISTEERARRCAICLEPIFQPCGRWGTKSCPPDETPIKLGCGHMYHTSCIQTHFTTSGGNECPECRESNVDNFDYYPRWNPFGGRPDQWRPRPEPSPSEVRRDQDIAAMLEPYYDPMARIRVMAAALGRDPDFTEILADVDDDGMALQHASPLARDDRIIVLRAVARTGHALQYASAALKDDREIVLAAVAQNPFALQFASAALQDDREIVLAAVTQRWRHHDVLSAAGTLNYASPSLQDDREIVLAAVANHGEALQYASPSLQGDRDIVLAASDVN